MHRRTLPGALAALIARPARAEAWPTRPIRIVVPFPAGGTTDLLARLYAQRLTETLGQSVVVENRGGGGGSIGAEVVAKATDGHTLLFHNLTFCTTTAALEFAGRAPHSIERDFAPLTLGANVPMMLLVGAQVPAQNLGEFIAWARAQDPAAFYGSTGPGSTINLMAEVLKRDANIRLDHVPFRGAAPLVQEMLAGRIAFGGDQLSSSLGHIRGGTLRPVATLASSRATALPQVGTVREQGFANLEMLGWNGFFAPARTPDPILARMAAETNRALDDAATGAKLVRQGFEPMPRLDPAGFRALLQADLAKWGPVIRAAGASLD